MISRWVGLVFILILAHCGGSLDEFNADGESDAEDTVGDTAVDTEEDPTEDPVEDDVPPDDIPPDDIPPDDIPPDDIPPDDIPPDDIPPDDIPPDDIPPDDIPPDDIPPDDIPPDDIPPDDIPPDDIPPDDIPPDDIPPDDIPPDDIPPDDIPPDDIPPEDIPMEDIPAERCDNGEDDDGDGKIDCMDSDCIDSDSCDGTCYPVDVISCGSSFSSSNYAEGHTNRMIENSCSEYLEWTGPEIAYEFVLEERSRINILLSGMTADLDLFLMGNTHERCDDRDCIQYSINVDRDDSITRTLDPGTYYIMADGYREATSTFTLSLSCNVTEICDNGEDDDGDDLVDCCDPDCFSAEVCDEICDNDEDDDCDDDVDCDDSDCDAFHECVEPCVPAAEAYCGMAVTGNTAGSGATDVIDSYSCYFLDETGPEYAYSFSTSSSRSVTFTIDNLSSTFLDLFVLVDNGGGCSPSNCVEYSATDDEADTVTVDINPGVTYYILVDGYADTSGTYRFSVNCP